jgi:hypothetical protein
VSGLNERRRAALRLRFGPDGRPACTLSAVGAQLGASTSVAAQLCDAALFALWRGWHRPDRSGAAAADLAEFAHLRRLAERKFGLPPGTSDPAGRCARGERRR